MQSVRHAYRLYGLQLESDLELPGLEGDWVAEPDLRISWTPLEADLGPGWVRRYRSSAAELKEPVLEVLEAPEVGQLRYHYRDGTRFLIDAGGRSIRGCWPQSIATASCSTTCCQSTSPALWSAPRSCASRTS